VFIYTKRRKLVDAEEEAASKADDEAAKVFTVEPFDTKAQTTSI
jgi:hypothetical protein